MIKPLKKMEIHEIIWLNIDASCTKDTDIDVYSSHYLVWRTGINIKVIPVRLCKWTLARVLNQNTVTVYSIYTKRITLL